MVEDDKFQLFLYRQVDGEVTRYFAFDRQLPPKDAQRLRLVKGCPELNLDQQSRINRLVSGYRGAERILVAKVEKILKE